MNKKYPSQIIKTLHGRAATYHIAINNINNASIVRINQIMISPATHQNNDNGKCKASEINFVWYPIFIRWTLGKNSNSYFVAIRRIDIVSLPSMVAYILVLTLLLSIGARRR